MITKIKIEHFQELIKKSYSLDHIYLLILIKQQFDVSLLCENSMKIAALYSGLIRKGLITEDNELTIIGNEILEYIESKSTKRLPKRKILSEEFDTWWEEFPSNNKFEYKGKSFPPTRTFKVKKDDCKLLFVKFVNEKKYTAHEIIEATKYDVLLRKENSISKNENQLTFLQNTLTYLNQESFQGYIELINEGIDIKETKQIYDGSNF